MQKPDTIVVSAQVRDRVRNMAERLGNIRVLADSRWQRFVVELGLDNVDVGAAATAVVVVGSPAAVLKHAAATTDEFGFVMPVAQQAAPWQRASSWRDDTTLDLWRLGWTPLAIDRVLVPVDDATLEFVIGNARQTPPSRQNMSAQGT